MIHNLKLLQEYSLAIFLLDLCLKGSAKIHNNGKVLTAYQFQYLDCHYDSKIFWIWICWWSYYREEFPWFSWLNVENVWDDRCPDQCEVTVNQGNTQNIKLQILTIARDGSKPLFSSTTASCLILIEKFLTSHNEFTL